MINLIVFLKNKLSQSRNINSIQKKTRQKFNKIFKIITRLEREEEREGEE